MPNDQQHCGHTEIAAMDGATGVTLIDCTQCRKRFERAPDSPHAFGIAGVVALMGGTEPEWQYLGLWQDGRLAGLYGLDHYRRRPKKATTPNGRNGR